MTTRPLSKTDYPQWRKLWDQYLVFYQHSLSEKQTQQTFERLTDSASGIYGLVLETDGELVGFAHSSFTHSTWQENRELYLEDLFVDPSARGKGHGRELIEAVASFARENGAPKLHWKTHKDNLNAQALYEKLATKSEFVIYEKEI
jgi:ribosomal protein S18 acetylase RimI-like enzyme